jgi:hypothetical protein
MLMDHVPEPPQGGEEPDPKPAVPMISIQWFESPDHAAEDHHMADQRSEDQRSADQTKTEPPRPAPARGSARVRPATPTGPDPARPATTDIQTTSGVPPTPIPQESGGSLPANGTEGPQRPARPATGTAKVVPPERKASGSARVPTTPRPETPRPDAPRPDAPRPDTRRPETPRPGMPRPDAPRPTAAPNSPRDGSAPQAPGAGGSAPQAPGAGGSAPPHAPGAGGSAPDDSAPAKSSEARATGTAKVPTAPPKSSGTAKVPVPPTPGAAEPTTAGTPDVPSAPEAKAAGLARAATAPAMDKPAPAADRPAPAVANPAPAVGKPPRADRAGAPPGDRLAAKKGAEKNGTAPPVVPAKRSVDETAVIPLPLVAPPPTETRPMVIPASAPPVVPGRTRQLRTVSPIKTAPEPVRDRRERRVKPRGGPYDLGHAPAVLVLSTIGVMVVAFSYAGGRQGTSGSIVAYWIGQIVVFTPVVTRLLSRRMAGVAESFLLVMGLAVNQYMLKWMYSPDQFRFPDELQHWLATTIIVQTGSLFQPNPALPPAVHFPGLAEMAAAIAQMTGMPVTASGILVAGVAHLIFVGVLFAAVLRASNSPAVAGVACATYATALHYLFFNSMFLYQTAALPFFMLAIWATRRWRQEGGRPFAFLAVVAVCMTTVSHHVTAFALVITLLMFGITELYTEKPRRWSALIMPGVAAAIVAAWILFVATDVIGYLAAPIEQIGETLSQMVTGGSSSSATPSIAVGQLAVQGIGLIGLFVLYLAVGRDMINRHDRDTWRWAALVGGLIFFLGNGVRFLGENGPEAAGRLATFTYVPISIIAAIALVRAVQIIPSRDAEGRRWWVQPALEVPPPKGRHLVLRVAGGSALVTVLMIGARAGGWPPVDSLLPGPYLAGGFERSVDAYGVDAAMWEQSTLGPGNRVGGDLTSINLASTYGRQNPVREVGPLFYSSEWGLADDQLVQDLGLQYLVVDKRLSQQLPESGAYFEADPQAGRLTHPLTGQQIDKFNTIPDVDRLYDNGNIRIYRMEG